MKEVQGKDVGILILDNSLLEAGYVSLIEASDVPQLQSRSDVINEFCEKLPKEPHSPQ